MQMRRNWRYVTVGLALFTSMQGLPGLCGSAASSAYALTSAAQLTDVPRLKPAPPEPEYISRLDLLRIQSIRADLDRRNFAPARASIETIEDPTARSLALWYYFDENDPNVDIEDGLNFLNAHEGWPSIDRIQRQLESRLEDTTPPDFILSFFKTRDPVSVDGKQQLARALNATGERDAARLQIQEMWVNDRLPIRDERRVLSNFGGILTADHHARRVDRLLFDREVTAARRIFDRLPSDERRRADARAQLLLSARGADAVYAGLSDADRADAGVLTAAVRYFRRNDNEPRAVAIARLAPREPDILRNANALWPDALWYEQQLLMRWALREKRYVDAYDMAAGHSLEPGSTDFSEAEFNAGWIALRFLNEPERAKVHFAALTASVSAPISLARGFYWLGRASDALDETASAISYYQYAADHPYTYYGQLANERLGLAPAFDPAPPAGPDDEARFAARSAAKALRMLTEIGDPRAFLFFSYALDDQLTTTGEYLTLARMARRIDAPHVTVRAGKVGVRTGGFAPQVSYPLIFVPEEATAFVAPEVILGLSRQESEFNPRAYSSAGARGLMQLLPSTARLTARKERLPYRHAALLDDPNYNMTIGSAHLSHLLTNFNGSYPMVFAGYNAGPHRVSRWIEEYGDPRSDTIDPIDWIELIPFSETRNYVQRVLENMQVYRSQLNNAPLAGHLTRDIESGGPAGRAAQGPIQGSANAPIIDVPARIEKLAADFFQSLSSPASAANEALSQPPSDTNISTGINGEAATEPVPSPVPAPAPAPASSGDAGEDLSSPQINTEADAEANSGANSGAGAASTTSGKTADIPAGVGGSLTQAPVETEDRPSPIKSSAFTEWPSGEAAASETAIDQAPAAPQPRKAIGAIPASARPPASAHSAADFSSDRSAEPDAECASYVAYIATVDEEEASADDLNAGAFAEWRSGNSGCAGTYSDADHAETGKVSPDGDATPPADDEYGSEETE